MITPDNEFYYFLDKISTFIDLKTIKNIFEIGSRDAHESVFFRKEFPQARVTCFEPNPTQKQECLDSIGDLDIQFYDIALSNFDGEADFYITNGNIGASSLLRPLDVPWTNNKSINNVKVNCSQLDTFCNLNNSYPDLIWIDVQGNELNVFKGGEYALSKVRAIYTEVGEEAYYVGHTLKGDIIDFLVNRCGFKLIDDKRAWQKESNLIFVK